MEENRNSTSIPDNLKRLVRITARAFYQPIHIVSLDILTKYPCVTESDLVEVLQMQGSQKYLRQALQVLRKDKLVKCQQRMESQEERTGVERSTGTTTGSEKPNMRMVYYYYINYREFANVVKYKLHRMRHKLEEDNSKVIRNKSLYVCTQCQSEYSDLDIDRLMNPMDETLRCMKCSTALEEHEEQSTREDSRTKMLQLNKCVEPITDLLRDTESLNLSSELLEPEPQSIQKYLNSKGITRRTSSSGKEQSNWATHSTRDIYGDRAEVKVNIGEAASATASANVKERPEWLTKSTVHTEEPSAEVAQLGLSAGNRLSQVTASKKSLDTERQIMEDLMAHEKRPGSSHSSLSPPPLPLHGGTQPAPQYSSSSSDEEEMVNEAASTTWLGAGDGEGGGFDESMNLEEGGSSEDEGYTVRIGDRIVPVDEVTSDMVAQMTEEEKKRYTEVYRMNVDDDF